MQTTEASTQAVWVGIVRRLYDHLQDNDDKLTQKIERSQQCSRNKIEITGGVRAVLSFILE